MRIQSALVLPAGAIRKLADCRNTSRGVEVRWGMREYFVKDALACKERMLASRKRMLKERMLASRKRVLASRKRMLRHPAFKERMLKSGCWHLKNRCLTPAFREKCACLLVVFYVRISVAQDEIAFFRPRHHQEYGDVNE